MIHSRVFVLDRSECLDRLGRGGIGRVAFSGSRGLSVLPVNFVVVDGEIVIRTSAYSSLHRAAERGADAAFEVDELDPGYRGGRSVLVRGQLRVRSDIPAVGLEPWGNQLADSFVSMAPTEVTGRMLRSPEV